MSGWIKLHRQIQDNEFWLSEPFSRGQAWVDLLLLCNHKPSFVRARGVKVKVDRGQCGWSQVKLARRWKWSRGKVIRFLDELESVQQIVQQKDNVTSLITIINYDHYQSDGTADSTANGQQIEQQTDSKRYTNKNDKNVNNEKEGERHGFAISAIYDWYSSLGTPLNYKQIREWQASINEVAKHTDYNVERQADMFNWARGKNMQIPKARFWRDDIAKWASIKTSEKSDSTGQIFYNPKDLL